MTRKAIDSQFNGFADVLFGPDSLLNRIADLIESTEPQSGSTVAPDNLHYAALGVLSVQRTVNRWVRYASASETVDSVDSSTIPVEDPLR